ncbi:class B sortase [Anaerococcus sp. DFU013_CI05]|uniref:class B sortase n=1 Tax=Anaerococcus sp. AH8042_DFU013_CI05 TaxID=3385202 RepID=UPI003A522F2F
MQTVANISRIGEKILDRIVAIILILVMLFAGYSLWNSYMLFRGGFAGDDLLKYKPQITEDGENPTLWDLMKINEDVVAWVTIDDTNIDHPVVQGEDNMEYVNKDVYKNFALSGSIFLDYRNNKEFKDPYSLLYGHHMDQGGMFGDVVLFEDQKYFDKHKTGTLFLPKETYNIEIFMVSKIDAYDSVIFNPSSISTMEGRQNLIEHARKTKLHERDINIGNDRIIALSTCEKATTNGRTVILGVIRPMNGDK